MQDPDYKAIAKSLDELLTKEKPKYLLLGESHTDSLINTELLRQPEILAVFQKHGFYDIAMEGHANFSPQLQKVADGEMSPKDFADHTVKEYREAGDKLASLAFAPSYHKARLTAEATPRGFQMHYVEQQFPNLKDHADYIDKESLARSKATEAFSEQQTFLDLIDNAYDNLTYTFRTESVEREWSAEEAAFNQSSPEGKTAQDILDERRAHDPQLAEKIIQATENRPAVIIYGRGHGYGKPENDPDLNEALGREQTMRITLLPDATQYFKVSQQDYNEGREAPSAYLIIKDARLIDGQKAFSDAKATHANPEDKVTEPLPEISPYVP